MLPTKCKHEIRKLILSKKIEKPPKIPKKSKKKHMNDIVKAPPYDWFSMSIVLVDA